VEWKEKGVKIGNFTTILLKSRKFIAFFGFYIITLKTDEKERREYPF